MGARSSRGLRLCEIEVARKLVLEKCERERVAIAHLYELIGAQPRALCERTQ